MLEEVDPAVPAAALVWDWSSLSLGRCLGTVVVLALGEGPCQEPLLPPDRPYAQNVF